MNLYTLDPVSKYLKASQSHLGINVDPYKQPKGNFLANPFSEYEERKKRFNDEYQSHLRMNQPKARRPSSRHRDNYSIQSPSLKEPGYELRNRRSPEKLSPILGGLSADRGKSYKQDSSIFERSPEKSFKSGDSFDKSEYNPQKSRIRAFRTPEPQEEYFPFGRPGAGAPYRDAYGKPIGDRKLFAEHAKVIMNTPVGYREISPDRSPYAEERTLREKQQEEMRKALLEQMETRKVKEEQERRRRLREELQEEERIRRELSQIDYDIRREVQEGELSRTFEDPPPIYRVPQKSIRLKSRSESVHKHIAYRSQPVAASPSPTKQSKFDAYRLRTETDQQNESIRLMISQLKDEKSYNKNYAWEAMRQFEDIKESVNYSSHTPSLYAAHDVHTPSFEHRWNTDTNLNKMALPQHSPHGHKSTHKSFESWGRVRPIVVDKDYSAVESPEARIQLSKLDELLKTTIDETPIIEDELDRAEPMEEL